MQRFEVTGGGSQDGTSELALWCSNRCGWYAEFEATGATTLAELVQRADEHTEVCR
jgi:hypothetical protein